MTTITYSYEAFKQGSSEEQLRATNKNVLRLVNILVF